MAVRLGPLVLVGALLAACGPVPTGRVAPETSVGRFSEAMRPALAAVARRVRLLPVLAPTRLSGSSRRPVSVTYHAAGSGYEVVIYLTHKPCRPTVRQ